MEAKKKTSSFQMACCGAEAILKTNELGTQFFAHKSKSASCSASDGESQEHQFAKYLVCRTLHELGWNVQAEKRGFTPDGKLWIADVYAEKGTTKVAVEIQWSPQSFVETQLRQEAYQMSGVQGGVAHHFADDLRQEAYQMSGVQGLWLMRDPKGKKNALTGDYAFRTRALPVFTLAVVNDEMRIYDIWISSSKFKYEQVSMALVDFIKTFARQKLNFIRRDAN